MTDPVKDYYKKISKHDKQSLIIQDNIDRGNAELQNKLYNAIQVLNKPRPKKTINPEENKKLDLQMQQDKYIELNDKLACSARDELLNKMMNASLYPLTLNDNVNDSYKNLKKNLNNIMTNPGDIESIVNTFSIEEINKLNTNWNNIQNKYINKYGFNNPNLTNNEIRTFLLNEMGMPNYNKSIDDIKEQMKKNSNIVDDNIKEVKSNILRLRNSLNSLILNKDIDPIVYQEKMDEFVELERIIEKTANENKKLEEKLKDLSIENTELKRDIKGITEQQKGPDNQLEDIEKDYNIVMESNEEMLDKTDKLNKSFGSMESIKTQEDEENEGMILNKKEENMIKELREIDSDFTDIQIQEALKLYDEYKTKANLLQYIETNKIGGEKKLNDMRPVLQRAKIPSLLYYIVFYNKPFALEENKEGEGIKRKRTVKKGRGIGIKKGGCMCECEDECNDKNDEYVQKANEWHKLGDNILINKKKLLDDNIISLTDRKKNKITLYKNKRISDNLVNIINKVINKSTVNKAELDNLKENEKLLYDSLIRKAVLHKEYNINVDDTIEKIKYKFKLLEGEIMAGNTNKELINEMAEVLRKMVNFKLIGTNKANNYLRDIKQINK
jgi:uncharacterized protein YneF (UPF0154 family)